MINLNKIIDLLMFRASQPDDDYSDKPLITTGSIVWGIIIRSAIIVVAMLLLKDNLQLNKYWYFSLFIFWAFVAYPAYIQYHKFNKRMDSFEEETLCGSCINFERSSQLCKLYDEHVSKNHIPCEGNDWQPKSLEDV